MPMTRWLLALGAPLAFAAQSLAAQDNSAKEADMMAAMAEVFAAPPLTAEQQARLPLATSVVDKLMPQGTMGEVMGSMFEGMLGPMMKLAEKAPPNLAEHIGYDASELDLTDEQVIEIAAIVDPAWRERREREGALMQEVMVDLMTAMEPAIRKGMSEAYAATFSVAELNDISAFFSTPSGATFARKSYQLANDPRIMVAAMGSLPVMLEQFAAMEAKMAAVTAQLGAKRTYATLTAAQRERIMGLAGLSAEELELGMQVAAEAAAEQNPF